MNTNTFRKRHSRTAIAAALAGCFGTIAPAFAAPGDPVGAPIVVGSDPSYGEHEAIARAADGRFVVVYRDSGNGLLAQRYAADGTPSGSPITIVSASEGDAAADPHVAMNTAGAFVVSYDHFGREIPISLLPIPILGPLVNFGLSGHSVHAQSFTADGVPLSGDVTTVRYVLPGFRTYLESAVAIDDDGDFTMAWHQYGTTPEIDVYAPAALLDHETIMARRFLAGGQPMTRALLVDKASLAQVGLNHAFGKQLDFGGPSVSSDAAGDFAVAWVSNSAAAGAQLKVQRYSAAGIAQGLATQANAAGDTYVPAYSLAMNSNGRLTVAWSGCASIVCARSFLPGGALDGGIIPVASDLTPAPAVYGQPPDGIDVAIDAAGDFFVSFEVFTQSGPGSYLRRIAADSSPLGPSVRFGTTTTYFPQRVASDASGDYAVLTQGDSNDNLLRVRLFYGP